MFQSNELGHSYGAGNKVEAMVVTRPACQGVRVKMTHNCDELQDLDEEEETAVGEAESGVAVS